MLLLGTVCKTRSMRRVHRSAARLESAHVPRGNIPNLNRTDSMPELKSLAATTNRWLLWLAPRLHQQSRIPAGGEDNMNDYAFSQSLTLKFDEAIALERLIARLG